MVFDHKLVVAAKMWNILNFEDTLSMKGDQLDKLCFSGIRFLLVYF